MKNVLLCLLLCAASSFAMNEADHNLLLATLCNDIDKAHVALDNGAQVDMPDGLGWTLLHQAVERKHVEMIHFLLDHGANLETRSMTGYTPLHLASRYTSPHFTSHYVPNDSCAIIRALLDRGADINAQDQHGHTPLDNALLTNAAYLVCKLLRERGAQTLCVTDQRINDLDACIEEDLLSEQIEQFGSLSLANGSEQPNHS